MVHVTPCSSSEAPDRTRVDVVTDLTITGKAAQFGRGVMQDVAARIIDQFAGNLAAMMTAATADRGDLPARADADAEGPAAGADETTPLRGPAAPRQSRGRRSTCSARPASRCSSGPSRRWSGSSRHRDHRLDLAGDRWGYVAQGSVSRTTTAAPPRRPMSQDARRCERWWHADSSAGRLRQGQPVATRSRCWSSTVTRRGWSREGTACCR